MLRLESLNDFEWRRLVERLDKAVAEAAREYLRHLHARRVPIRPDDWDLELDELRLAREPDYDKPGVPLVYALKYMPRRSSRYSDRCSAYISMAIRRVFWM